MKLIHATTLSGFVLTAIILYLLGYVPYIPAWPVFIAWACFFHMEGGLHKNQAYFATILHIALGAFTSWISALLVLNNPFQHALASQLWAPILIAAVIAGLLRLSAIPRFSVTPAIIYGYASIWAFVSAPGLLNIDTLLSLSFQNALIAIIVSIILGASCGFVNALMVSFLCGLHLPDFTKRRFANRQVY